MVKLIHAADLHLGSPVSCAPFAGFDPAEAPFQAFERLIDLCIDERAGALLLAGDQFDKGDPHPSTERRFNNGIERLNRAGIPVFAILGNHDALFFERRKLTAPEGLTLFPTERADTATLTIEGVEIALHGRSFPSEKVEDGDFALSYPKTDAGRVNIGLLHTSLEGAGYAPISTPDLLAKGYDFWALGHVHKPKHYGDGPIPAAAYSGNLQGRDIGERGEPDKLQRGANILTIEGSRITSIEPRFLGLANWQSISLDLSESADFNAAKTRMIRAVEGIDDSTRQIVRLELKGRFADAASLHRQELALLEQLNEISSDRVQVHSLKIKPKGSSAAAPSSGSGVDWTLDPSDIDESRLKLLRTRLKAADLAGSELSADIDQAAAIARAVMRGNGEV